VGHFVKTPREFPIQPFRGWYDATVWCRANARGQCSVLIPWEILKWNPSKGLTFIADWTERGK